MIRVGSLFSGIGGLDIGIPDAEHEWLCEFDPHARRVLASRFPDVPIYEDVRELDGSVPPVDVLVGGYPCQPFSVAGRREGENDPRHLWPEFARLIRVLRPRFVFAENVSGHLGLGFDRVLADLAEAGFDAEWVVVRASDVGAPHRRERLFVLASDARRAGAGRDGRAAPEGEERLGWRQPHEADVPVSGGEAVAADADLGRREQHLASIGGLPAAVSSDAPPADADDRLVRIEAGNRENGGVGIEPGHDADGRDLAGGGQNDGHDRHTAPEWGDYAAAIRRWEHVLGRAAPPPTDAQGRLMPAFVEWMMGYPSGWVTSTDVSRTQALRMLGNAVVPQQARLAWAILTEQAADA